MKNIIYKWKLLIPVGMVLSLGMSACSDILDAKPQQSLLVPSKLSDYQSLLDNFSVMNNFTPGIVNITTDDFYITENGWQSLSTPLEQNMYLWKEDAYDSQIDVWDWSRPYKAIFYTNIVLDGIEDITDAPANQQERNQIRAEALFYRGFAYYHLAQAFCLAYDPQTAHATPGLPLKLSSDVGMSAQDATLEELYEQIHSDMVYAAELLQEHTIHSKPSKEACFAMLARIRLLTQDYKEASDWAEKALAINDALLDFNTLPIDDLRPFPRSFMEENREVVFYSTTLAYSFNRSALAFVADELYDQYDENDLRKRGFFNPTPEGANIKGTYTGTSSRFSGISNNELYLISAECHARMGDYGRARARINALLQNRYGTNTFSGVEVSDVDLLEFILLERRKELVGRDIRWTDLKRLNLDPAFAKTLTREFNGQTYTLPPNDKRYAFPFPASETIHNNP